MAIKGDFISFTYNGVHSTELGVVRVSSSNRYNDSLLPTIQDKTTQVPGNDGTYFFGSYYTQRPITIDVAFDEVTEDQIRQMRALFGDKLAHQLTFDDEPYKIYYAKSTGTPQLKYIPFGSPRVYKGEGTFTFTCYDPFAHCPNEYKYLDQWVQFTYRRAIVFNETHFNRIKLGLYYKVDDEYIKCTETSVYNSSITYYTRINSPLPPWYKIDNKDEWNLSANLLNTKGDFDTYVSNSGFKIYNPGDVATDFKFIMPIGATISGIKIANIFGDLDSHILLLKNTPIIAKGTDTHICFNSKMNLIQGYKNGERTGNIYNEYIGSGHWFQIPIYKTNETNETNEINEIGDLIANAYYFVPIDYDGDTPELRYDYLYY